MHTDIKNNQVIAFIVLVGFASLVLLGCTNAGTSTVTNTNSNANAPMGNAGTTPAPMSGSVEAREPDRYSVTNTITIQPTGNSPQTNIPPLQFTFARIGTDRRV